MHKERIVKLVILLLFIFSGSIYSKKLTPSVTITKVEGILAFGNTILFTASGYDNDSQNGGQAPRIEWDFSYEEASGFRVDAVTNNESASTVTHIYDRKGTYTVIARYYDNDGARKDSYRQITISGLKRYYYVKDHLGNIRQTLDERLNIVSAQDYAPYGALLREYNESSPNEKYKFTEKERDKESNFDYFGARYYDSEIGRWLSVDPLADKYPGWSPYNYTLNNPINNFDPNGKEPWNIAANPVFSSSFANGFISTISNSVTGTWEAITSPLETGKGIIGAFSNPSETLGAIGDGISQTMSDLASPNPLVSGEALGNVAAVGVEAAVGTKGISKAIGTTKKVMSTSKTSNKVSGLTKQLNAHKKKLVDYKANPDAFDNKGFLKNATAKQRESIINGRIKKLEKQIRTFEKDIENAKR